MTMYADAAPKVSMFINFELHATQRASLPWSINTLVGETAELNAQAFSFRKTIIYEKAA